MDLQHLRKWCYPMAVIATGFTALLLWAAYQKWPTPVTAVLTPVNQSPWEMGKLLFWPFLPGLVLLHHFRQRIKTLYVLLFTMPLALTALQALTRGVFPMWMLMSAVLIVGLWAEAHIHRRLWGSTALWQILSLLLGLAYILFTILPPIWGLFMPLDSAVFAPAIPY